MMEFSHNHQNWEHAVKFADRFLLQFGEKVKGVLSCFDRVIFKGYLPFHNEGELNSWVDYGLRVRRSDFLQQLDQRSGELVGHAKALSVVNDPTPAYRRVQELTESKIHQGRRYAGFNPARSRDVRLFQAVLSGSHELRGFHNPDMRNQLFRESRDPVERRRQATNVSRLLKRLPVKALIAKIPRTRRWRITAKGRSRLGTILQLHYHGLPLAV